MTDLRIAPPSAPQKGEILAFADASGRSGPRGLGLSQVAPAANDRAASAHDTADAPDRLLAINPVLGIVGVGKSTWLKLVREKAAPAPVRIGRRCTRWSANAVNAWVRARLAESAK